MTDKYLSRKTGRRERTCGVEIARTKIDGAIVHLAATWDPESIRFWWTNAGRWRCIERANARLEDRFESCLRVSCIADGERVHLVYRRALDGSDPNATFVETFRLASRAPDITFEREALVEIPFLALGFVGALSTLWAGRDPERKTLLVVTRSYAVRLGAAVEGSRLLLMIGRAPFREASDWHVLDLDDGGYSADALRGRRRLVIVHRKKEAAFGIQSSAIPPVATDEPGIAARLRIRADDYAFADLYHPLHVRVVDLDTETTVEHWDLFSGGEHPQVQTTDPVRITVDRIHTASLVVRSVAFPRDWSSSNREPRRAEWRLQWEYLHYAKQLIEPQDYRVDLFVYNALELPRPLLDLPPAFLPSMTWWEGEFTERFPRVPVFVTAVKDDIDRKEVLVDVLAHVNHRLELRRYALSHPSGWLRSRETGRAVIDINHEAMDRSAIDRDPAENTQFGPADVEIDRWRHLFQPYTIDDTIGGLLTVDRSALPALHAGYTDFGDGGPRVVIAPSFAGVPRPPGKELAPDEVPGAPGPRDHWVELSSAEGFVDSALEPYAIDPVDAVNPPVAIVTPLQVALEGLVGLATSIPVGNPSTLPSGVTAPVFTRSELRATQALVDGLSDAIGTAVGDGAFPRLDFSMKPKAPSDKVRVDYVATIQLDTTAPPLPSRPGDLAVLTVSPFPAFSNHPLVASASPRFPPAPPVFSDVATPPIVHMEYGPEKACENLAITFTATIEQPPSGLAPPSIAWEFFRTDATGARSNDGPRREGATITRTLGAGPVEVVVTATYPNGPTRTVTRTIAVGGPAFFEWTIDLERTFRTPADMPAVAIGSLLPGPHRLDLRAFRAAPSGGGDETLATVTSVFTVQPLPTVSVVLAEPLPDGSTGPAMATTVLSPTGATLGWGGPQIVPRTGKWRATATATFADGTSRAGSLDWKAGDALEDTLWEVVRSINEARPMGLPWGFVDYVELSAGFASLYLRSEGVGARLARVTIALSEPFVAKYRFVSGGEQQGRVDYRIRLLLRTRYVRISGPLAAFVAIDGLHAPIWVGRQYTPCVLHSDVRSRRLAGDDASTFETISPGHNETVAPACGLAMKPVSDSYIDVSELTVSARLLPVLDNPRVLIALLVILGLTSLVPVVGIAAAAGLIGLLVLVGIKATTRRAVERLIAQQIRSAIESSDAAGKIGSTVLRYAGEGLAEDIARRAIARAASDGVAIAPPDAREAGRVRMRDQAFQMVVATEGKLRLLIRPPAS